MRDCSDGRSRLRYQATPTRLRANVLAFLFGGVLYQLGDQLFGLRPVAADRFDEDRVGPGHLSFAVSSRDVLDDATSLLEEWGVEHEEVKDIGIAWILKFRDPDNIALELTAPKND